MQSSLEAAARAALLGLAVGDALGVPVEFLSRVARQQDPVTGMRAYGTHRQSAGTWSDDSSLTFCLAETLALPGGLKNGLPDLNDFAQRSINWLYKSYWTAHGETFDVGNATRTAIGRLQRGTEPTKAGPNLESDNGNGALMRILPLVFHDTWRAEALDLNAAWALTEAVASVTHGHPRSTLGCFLYLLVARGLLSGFGIAASVEQARTAGYNWLQTQAKGPVFYEWPHYRRVLDGTLLDQPESTISSSGYVVDTLEAALWCLLEHDTYAATVLAAVNLGDDTDTTGAVAGGLAGLAYGEAAIPAEWLAVLARRADIEDLAQRLAAGQ
ncbi:ADP-ribosylglycohydrolase family protein [Hymenobacter properus]|uniref:ADP-ribosylglycohydrolase family protein n=1 Tax=Hymenobacter properus TaxID=2791026 RepID=A0A931FI42_9BACT|nr:ADP-ribosylglycohydrolase family protein [Hymenobacter properus]MBF9140368.1 ADP-ribosylglycohydrolase family protein [Hymenobacter properus]MBR7719175.1 ADP-ribosylglycohydrolase family protein [Microvirga sp. SRT04]